MCSYFMDFSPLLSIFIYFAQTDKMRSLFKMAVGSTWYPILRTSLLFAQDVLKRQNSKMVPETSAPW